MNKVILSFLLLLSIPGSAQHANRFDNEVNELIAKDSLIDHKDIILFIGTSSIRLWKDLPVYFPEHNVVSRGFGGSEMNDLIYYADKLILPYRPRMIFIYEGENELKNGKSPEEILKSADSLLSLVRKELPSVLVIFISTKPSVARWELKERYETYNLKLKAWTKTKQNVAFADVWTPMLDRVGNVRKDLFIEDNLHMNKDGYDIWARVIKKYFRD